MKIYIKKAFNAFDSLSSREKMVVGPIAIILSLLAIYYPIQMVRGYVTETRTIREVNLSKLDDAAILVQRHRQLKSMLSAAENSFDEAQMTYEQATSEIDKIIKKTVGEGIKYDFKKRDPSDLGMDYVKEEYFLSLTTDLPQLVKLLHEFEKGETPLFLGKVGISKISRKGEFRTSLDVFSVREKTS